jgi:O-antigen/teichoic acid export membrane protein
MVTIPTDLRALLRTGLTRSLLSLLIKVATAGLTYAGLVVLSRTMDGAAYGDFAAGLALATVLAILAGLGQQIAILRFWPEDMAKSRSGSAEASLRAGGTLTVGAGLVLGLLTALVGLSAQLVFGTPDSFGHWAATGALVLPLALAEYNSSALRAQGSVMAALLPRDIVWRLALPVATLLFWFSFGYALSGPEALLLAAALLLLSLALQYGWATLRDYRLLPGMAGTAAYWKERGAISRWFLIGAAVDTLALNADTILVGLLVDAQSAGVYFNAFRTAGLMTLFSFAVTLVVAPMISQHFHSGDLRKAQAITAAGCWAGFVFSLVAFAVFALWGTPILTLFGEGYGEAYPILMLLGFGLLIDAAAGPTRTVMMMTGHERTYVWIFGAITATGIVAQVLVLPMWGLVGAAAVNMVARILAQVALGWWCYRKSGIDPTILGIARINRPSQLPPLAPAPLPRTGVVS